MQNNDLQGKSSSQLLLTAKNIAEGKVPEPIQLQNLSKKMFGFKREL